MRLNNPIRRNLAESLDLVIFTNASKIRQFRKTQTDAFEQLGNQTRLLSDTWLAQMPAGILSATGVFDVSLLSALIEMLQLGTNDWVGQLIYGFPLTGFLSQSGVFPSPNEPLLELGDPNRVFLTASARFSHRSMLRKSPH